MRTESIENLAERTEMIRTLAHAAGFISPRFLVPFEPRAAAGGAVPPGYAEGAPALLVVALPYGNDDPDGRTASGVSSEAKPPRKPAPPPATPGRIAPFARRNYYAEAVARLKGLAIELRQRYGGVKSDYRILCNSPIPEKPLAEACGLGAVGRNTLIITREAGSLVILAAMTLPFEVAADVSIPGEPKVNDVYKINNEDKISRVCRGCRACAEACPTKALPGDGTLDRTRCIQWYASGNGEVPDFIAAAWSDRLYGCTVCQDVCPHNKRPIRGIATDRGPLPATMDAAKLIELSDDELRERFRGSAMGMAWLGPAAIRRNAAFAAKRPKDREPRSGDDPTREP